MPEIAVVMPKMSMTMTEGEVVAWRRAAGEAVREGDVVAEVLTDKVEMEVESPATGILARLLAAAGDRVPVGEPLAYITSESDGLLEGFFGPTDGGSPSTGSAAQPEGALSSDAGAQPDGGPSDAVASAGSVGTDGPAADGSTPAGSRPVPPSRKSGVPALPGARRLAAVLGISLDSLDATGPDGAVSVRDVEAAAARRGAVAGGAVSPAASSASSAAASSSSSSRASSSPASSSPASSSPASSSTAAFGAPTSAQPFPAAVPSAAAAPAAAAPAAAVPAAAAPAVSSPAAPPTAATPAPAIDPGFSDVLAARRTQVRAAVSAVMQQSATVPQFTVFRDLELDAMDPVRQGVSWTTVLVAVLARALQPDAALGGEAGSVHVSLAVDTPIGLLAPVVRGADALSLDEVDGAVRAAAERARSGRLTPSDISGGTTTVSNLGRWGVESFNALLTPPQASALSTGAIAGKPVARRGALAIATVCRVGLTVDHRVADGADAARVLARMAELLESPAWARR